MEGDREKTPLHALEVEDAVARLASDKSAGLSDAEARERLGRSGANELPHGKKTSWLAILLRPFKSNLTQILAIAAAVSWYVGETADAVGIIVAVLIDATASLVQETRAEQAIERLRSMMVHESTVVRGGKVHRIPSKNVVPGDVVVLEEGDRVPADARLIECRDLLIDESALTGESVPVNKSLEPVDDETEVADRGCMTWMGTVVVGGSGRAVVSSTGVSTEFGKIALSLGQIDVPKTPLEVQVSKLGRNLGLAAVAIVAIIFVMGLVNGEPLYDLFLFSVSLTVSVIPEGLPAVLAVVLAIGVQRMAKRNAVIRRVRSVDTLGAIDVICTDKTGTLTENRMTVREVALSSHRLTVTGEGLSFEGGFKMGDRDVHPSELPELDQLIRTCSLVARAEIEFREGHPNLIGDPTDGAMMVLANKGGFSRDRVQREFKEVDEIPFNSVRKYHAVLRDKVGIHGERKRYLFVVGAYVALRDRVGSVMDHGDAGLFGEHAREVFQRNNDEMAGRALRVLAVAYKEMPLDRESVEDSDVSDLTLVGLLGMIDPPRAGVADSIAKCHAAGIRVLMITGDQRKTALAIGREIGLVGDDDEVDGRVFTERQVAAMTDEEFDAAIDKAVVFARVTPQTKLRVVEALDRRGHVVAMTGDGVNDAPALKRAGVGIAMGVVGTDVSREVADMVLADDNFVSIVNAIEEGRIIFRNVKQTTAYLFMTNFGEAATIIVSIIIGLPLPLLPTQILWMNLVTDGLPDMALAAERSHEGVLEESPRPRNASLLPRNTLILAGIVAACMTVGTLGLFLVSLPEFGVDKARTMAFTTMSIFQLWNVFNMRSDHFSIFHLGFFSNWFVTVSVVISVAFQVAAVYFPPFQKILRTVPLSSGDWLLIVVITSSVFWVVEFYKWLIRRGWVPASWLST